MAVNASLWDDSAVVLEGQGENGELTGMGYRQGRKVGGQALLELSGTLARWKRYAGRKEVIPLKCPSVPSDLMTLNQYHVC